MNNRSRKVEKMAKMGMLIALSLVLISIPFLRFMIFPAVPFLQYDAGAIPMLIASFAFGPLAGLVVTVITATLQTLMFSSSGGPYGWIMNVIATGTFVVTAGLIYSKAKEKTRKVAIIALLCGMMAQTLIMIPANYIVTPIFLTTEISAVTALMPWIVAFNLTRTGINAMVTFFLYKQIRRFL